MHSKPPFDWIAPAQPAVAPAIELDPQDEPQPRPELRLVPDVSGASDADTGESGATPWKR